MRLTGAEWPRCYNGDRIRHLGPTATRWLVTTLVVATVAGYAEGTAARADASENIVSESRTTGLSAYGGVLVWSSYSTELRRYRLTALRNGRVTRLPVRSRSVPFDADVGPDARGEPQIVYSRCADEPRAVTFGSPDYTSGRGCRLWRYDLGRGSERRVRNTGIGRGSAFRPSIWGSRLAYGVSTRKGDSVTLQYRVLSLRSGKRRRVVVRSRLASRAKAGTTVTGVDLFGGRLTVGLDHADVDCGGTPAAGDKVGADASEIFAGSSSSPRRIVVACGGDLVRAQAPSWHGGAVFALVQQRVNQGRVVERRREISTDGQTVAEVDVPSGTDANATDRTGSYVVVFRSAAETGASADTFTVQRHLPSSPSK